MCVYFMHNTSGHRSKYVAISTRIPFELTPMTQIHM